MDTPTQPTPKTWTPPDGWSAPSSGPHAPTVAVPVTRRRRWPWLVAAIVLGLVVLGVIGGAARATTTVAGNPSPAPPAVVVKPAVPGPPAQDPPASKPPTRQAAPQAAPKPKPKPKAAPAPTLDADDKAMLETCQLKTGKSRAACLPSVEDWKRTVKPNLPKAPPTAKPGQPVSPGENAMRACVAQTGWTRAQCAADAAAGNAN